MGKKAIRKTEPPTYREALTGMRRAAHSGVQDAIDGARDAYIHPQRRRVSGQRAGHEAQALFDGIIAAVAESVIRTSRPGREVEMADLVAKLLVSKVQSMSCVGQA